MVEQDVQALEALYERYSRPIFSLGLKILGSHDVVEEVVQEVFMRLWTRAAGYDAARGRLLSWLLTITHHRAVDELRRRRTRLEIANLDEVLGEAPDTDPTRSLDHVALRVAVQRALAQLPQAQRQPIEMAYFGGMTQVEISHALDVPLGTIKTRTRLGLLKLRALLEGEPLMSQASPD